jgi:DNA-binding beta-propeller fold protein YncE
MVPRYSASILGLALLSLLSACGLIAPSSPQAELATAAAPTHVFSSQWGGLGTQLGKFKYPYGIALDSGYVYVADSNNSRVQKFTTGGTHVLSWGSRGSAEGQFLSPRGVAVGSDGSVYVLDTSNDRVQKFDPNGVFLTSWGGLGSGNGQLNTPFGITVDGSGYVYVADTENQRIQKFDPNGVFVTKWGRSGTGKGQFNNPVGIAVDASGDVFVSELFNHRVQRFSAAGTFEAMWGGYGTAAGSFRQPYGLAVDGSGRVFVADKDNLRVQMFSPDGTLLGGWATENSAHANPNYPLGVAVAPDGSVYVTDLYNHLVQVFVPASGEVPTVLLRTSGRGTFSQPATLRASVTVDGDPSGGTTVNFALNGVSVGSAVTDAAGVASLGGVSLAGISAGIYDGAVQADFTAGEVYGSAKGLLRVDKAPQTLRFTSTIPTRARVGSSLKITATASSGLPVVISSDTPETCTVSSGVAAFNAPGSCSLRAAQAGNNNYHAAPELVQEVTVHDNALTTLSSVSGSGVYNGSATLSATLEGGGVRLAGKAVGFTLQGQPLGTAITDSQGHATLSGVPLAGLGAGSYVDAITAHFAADEDFEASQGKGTLVVAKAAQTLTFTSSPPTNAAVGGSYTVSATASSGLGVSYASATTGVCTVSGTSVSFVGAGTCTVSAAQPGNANYHAAASILQSFGITSPTTTATYTVNFSSSTVPVGRVITSVSLGRGIVSSTGKATGDVSLYAKRKDKTGNVAMVIGTPRHLVISKDGVNKISYGLGGTIDFGFSSFGSGSTLVKTLKVRSTTTTGGTVSVYRGGTLLKTISVPKTGSGVTKTLSVNVANATLVRVTLTGVGAVDDLVFTQ